MSRPILEVPPKASAAMIDRPSLPERTPSMGPIPPLPRVQAERVWKRAIEMQAEMGDFVSAADVAGVAAELNVDERYLRAAIEEIQPSASAPPATGPWLAQRCEERTGDASWRAVDSKNGDFIRDEDGIAETGNFQLPASLAAPSPREAARAPWERDRLLRALDFAARWVSCRIMRWRSVRESSLLPPGSSARSQQTPTLKDGVAALLDRLESMYSESAAADGRWNAGYHAACRDLLDEVRSLAAAAGVAEEEESQERIRARGERMDRHDSG